MTKIIESVRLSLRWTAVATYTLLLTFELLTSNPWTVLFPTSVSEHPPVDVSSDLMSFFLHSGTFLGLGLLLQWALAGKSRTQVLLALSWAIAHGGVCEYLQKFVPERWPSWDDALCNAFGITLSYVIVQSALVLLHKRPDPTPTATLNLQ
jgi:VanZ family protein